MPSLYAETTIHAPRSRVWQTLIQKANWLKWNTFLYDRTPQQPFREGQKLLLSLRRVDGDEETEFQAVITLVQPDVCLKWVSSAPGFQSEHVFELQDLGANLTKYTHRERLTGWLIPAILPLIRRDEQQGLRRMATELKYYVERYS